MGKKGKIGKQRKDRYYHLAKETGYRSRAAFKLIQLNRKFEFLQKSKVLIDLCAAPGGWCQVAQKFMPVPSIIVGVDLAPIKAIHNVITLVEDITTQQCRTAISKELKTWKADVVLHDGAPNVGKSWYHDAFEQNRLTLSALHLACDFLVAGGWFITKVFRSKDYNALMWVFKKLFKRVHATKPQASRNESAEIFVVCQHFLAPAKIDPRFFDATAVFAEVAAKEHRMTKTDLFKPLLKPKKAKALGYDDEAVLMVFSKAKASDFIASVDYVEILSKANEIDIDTAEIRAHPATTEEVVRLVQDLKVLGRKDLTTLITWREKVRRDWIANKKKLNQDDVEELEDIENDDDDDNNEEVEPVDEDPATTEEAQKLKKLKRKKAKEQKKLEERLQLQMVFKNDRLYEEEHELFNLNRLKKRSALNSFDIAQPDMVVDEAQPKEKASKKVLVDKENEKRYFDPDDSDAVGSEDEDDQQALEFEDNDDIVIDDDDDDQDGLLVDFQSKDEKVNNMTKMFFDNKIFNNKVAGGRGGGDDDQDMLDDDEIELQELENRTTRKKMEKAIAAGGVGVDSVKPEVAVRNIEKELTEGEAAIDGGEEESDSDTDSEDELNKVDDENKVSLNGERLTPEELALGGLLIKSAKTRRDLTDDAWNRYNHEDDEFLPSWFRAEEANYYRRPIPVTQEMVGEYRAQLRDINSKPIKKVMEAKARKKKRALRRLEKARHKADAITDDAEMGSKEKAEYIKSIYKKAIKKNENKVQLVVGKKRFGRSRPPGVKGRYKIVDARLKKDKRANDKKTGGGGKKAAPKGKRGKPAKAGGGGKGRPKRK